jgi:two-component system, chemotaxis family, protein-glutamate methylesterase/glutaminase
VPGHDIIVVGASAGGVETLRTLVKGLPAELPAAVFVVLHVAPRATSLLPEILGRVGALPVRGAIDGEPIQPGRVYVGMADHHLLVDEERVRLVRGPKENRMRPSVDVLFRSAASAYGPRVIGVVLTGTLDDGAAGARVIKRRGGLVVVQDPRDALFPDMPRAALESGAADHCLPVTAMPALLAQLASQPAPPAAAFPPLPDVEIENRIAHAAESDAEVVGQLGTSSRYTCPECQGVLWQIGDGERVRFRCQVGHAFSGASLVDYQRESLEDTLWAAVRSLNENADLARKLEQTALKTSRTGSAQRFRARAEQAAAHADRIRSLLESQPVLTEAGGEEEVP